MSEAITNDSVYDNVHRALLQAFLARQSMTYDSARALLAIIRNVHDPDLNLRPEAITHDDFNYYIGTINENISSFDMAIKSTRDQRNGEEILAFVNLTSDQLSQMATSHSADEIAYIRRLLDAMFETYNTREAEIMALTGIQAVNLAKPRTEDRRDSGNGTASTTTAALTKPQAEHMLMSMVEEGWFQKSQKGFYSLTPRALAELKEWLFDTYNDEEAEDEEDSRRIKICAACKDIITTGQRCPNRRCTGRLHELCVEKMFRAQGNRQTCPVCNEDWKDPLPVGERAARATNSSRPSYVPRTSDTLMRDGDDY